MTSRTASIERATSETSIRVDLRLDGEGSSQIQTGLGFFDHMLIALARHGRFDLTLTCRGDLHVDDHHTIEDCGLALGQAFDQALGDRAGIERFGWALIPMDEALARCAIDLSGRPSPAIDLRLERESIGDVATENLPHFFRSLAVALRAAVHIDILKGANDHHRAEAAFKSFAVALKNAVRATGDARIPSTKGVL